VITEPERITYVDHTAMLGGAELSLCSLVAALDRARWHPTAILWEPGPLRTRLESLDVAVTVTGMSSALRSLRRSQVAGPKQLNPQLTVALIRQLALVSRELRKSRAALVHTNSLKACVLGGLAGRLLGIPVVWQVHSVVSAQKMRPRAVRALRSLAGWLPDHIICNSQATALSFTNSSKVTVVPCGVPSVVPRPHGTRTNCSPRIGMVARFSHEKGQHILIDVAELLARHSTGIDWVFAGTAMFGEDGYERDIRSRAKRGPLANRIHFMGFVEDVPSLMRYLDIVVHPSVEPEGLGQTVIEAMMAGKPVVVSAAGGSAELVEDGVTGRLVPPDDAVALAAAIGDLLAHPAQAAEMGRRAREVALERYDIRKTTRAIEDVYERVLGRA
jgi:glycosyltransferase involved in cell wall biosynthesis